MARTKFVKSSVETDKSNGEITFIAARNARNLNGIEYETSSLLAQTATGDYLTLKSEWQDVAIPLMRNHSDDTEEKIGNIDKARLATVDGVEQVEMHAKFFKGEKAQETRQRVLDGELTDVSITTDWGSGYTDEDDMDALKNAHIIEVSVVYAGAEPKAKILAKNSVEKEEEMAEEVQPTQPTQPEEVKPATVELNDSELDELATKVAEKLQQPKEADEAEAEEAEDESENTINEEENPEMATQPTIAAADAREASKEQVLNSLAKLAKNGVVRGMNKNQVIEAVKNDITITDGGVGTYVVPDAVWTEILGAKRETDILSTFKTSAVRRKTILAEERSEADGARAGKYTKDVLKTIQDLSLVPVKLETEFLYKLQKISYEDLQEDFGNVLYNFVKQELPQKLDEEEERAFIVGDGRLSNDDRHITAIVSLDAAAADSSNISVYNYNGSADGSAVEAVMNGIAKLDESGTRYAVMSLATLTKMRQAGLSTNSGLPFSVDVVAGAMGVDKIFTREYVPANVVFVWTGGFVERLTGPVDNIEQYDIDYNNRKIEALRRVGGGATGVFSAVKVTLPATVSA